MLPEVQYVTDIQRNVTGARGLAGSFRDRLAAAKAKIASVESSMTTAMDDLERTAELAEAVARDVEREAVELQQSLAAFTNGGPNGG